MNLTAFFSLALGISIVGLVTLLVLKHYELTTNRVILGRVRPALGHFFHRVLVFIERGVPRVVRVFVLRVARERAQQAIAHVILFFERVLENTLHLVRQKSQVPRQGGVASQFLQEVAAHKQKLLRRTPKKRMILDE